MVTRLFAFLYLLAPLVNSDSCEVFKEDKAIDVLAKCTGKEIFIERGDVGIFDLHSLTIDQINRLFENLRELNVPIRIENISGETINFPKLEKILTFGNLVISRNKNLKNVYFPHLKDVDLLPSANITSSPDFIGHFEVIENEKLETLYFPEMTQYDPIATVIANNSVLKSFLAPRIENFEGDILIQGNQQLRRFAVQDKLKHVFTKNFTVLENSQLEEIVFKYQSKGYKFYGNLTVKGNPKLSPAVIDTFNETWANGDKILQEFGECIFQEEVKDLSKLDDCRYIYGSLKLATGATGKTNTSLKRIEGDAFAADLPIDKLNFLKNSTIQGQMESLVCEFDYSQFIARSFPSPKPCPFIIASESSSSDAPISSLPQSEVSIEFETKSDSDRSRLIMTIASCACCLAILVSLCYYCIKRPKNQKQPKFRMPQQERSFSSSSSSESA